MLDNILETLMQNTYDIPSIGKISKSKYKINCSASNCTLINNINDFVSITEYSIDNKIQINILQDKILLYGIKLYLLNTNNINKKNYKEINKITISNLQYCCKFVSIAYYTSMLLDIINFMICCIDIQRNISKWIKIVPIFVFVVTQEGHIICGYLMNYVEAEQIDDIIQDKLYWEYNNKKINNKIISLIDKLTQHNITIYNISYHDLLWDRTADLLYYTGIEYDEFHHPVFDDEIIDNEYIKNNNNLIKQNLHLLSDNNDNNLIDMVINCVYPDRKNN
jgi:phosphotransferase system IIA component